MKIEDMRYSPWFLSVCLVVLAIGYYGNSSLAEKTEARRSECYDALDKNERFIAWYDLNTVFSFFEPYIFYRNNNQVFQFRTSNKGSLVCYRYTASIEGTNDDA